ncbi:PREDICTED: calsequestrin-1-like [Acropora digitifera]|uniref:calsequestrin-1-like n=1 Tax=Acropora digitifera TaxID=70779 RepID=UPI00077A4890|nr:PREDICTED: calsequestrin-1-like [Acropora digitifera]
MKAVILAVHLTIFFRSAYLSDQELDEPQGEEQRLPHYLKDDGIRRVAKLDKLHFNKTLKASRMLVVLFYFSNSGDKKLDNTWKTDEKMLEIVARVLQPQGVNIGSVNIAESLELSQNLGEFQFNFETLFGREIHSGAHARNNANTTGLNHDTDAPFTLAKALRLKKPNSIQLLKPYEKPVSFPSSQAITAENINLFIEENKKNILTKVRLEDIHYTWSSEVKGFLIMAFVRLETNAGVEFFSLVKSLAKRYGNKKNLHFMWVDPDPFPTMRDYWQRSYNIDVNSPVIGVIEPKLTTSSWFERKGKETKLRHLQQWVEDILAGKVELKAPQNSTESSQGENKKEPIVKEEL